MSQSIRLVLTISLVCAAILAAGVPSVGAERRQGDLIPNQYIVVFTDAVADPTAHAQGLATAHGLTLSHTYSHALKGFAAVIPAARLAQLKAHPDVAYVVSDEVVQIAAQTVPTGIRRIDAPLSPTAKINGVDERVAVDVAVIDTGIDTRHPDLVVAGGKSCLRGQGYNDGNGHGTHVAGTIGAKDNTAGVVGVAPGARLWAVRVLDSNGSGSWSSVICGVDYVTQNKATIEVANLSLGGSGSEPSAAGCATGNALHDAVCRSVAAGVTYVVAAGNSAADARGFVPAAYDEVITVSALADFNGVGGGGAAATCRADEDDTFANFSNYGADVDLIAPGVCILSTAMGGGTTTLSGTSMAAPHVAGAAALYKAKNPSATPAQVRSALINAGSSTWNNGDDRDQIKERLLNVKNF